MEGEKIFGWLILFIGVGIIAISLFYSMDIFTGHSEPPEVFKEDMFENIEWAEEETTGAYDIQAQAEEIAQKQIRTMIPLEDLLDSLPKLLNLLSWSIFMGIVIFASGQIAGLGIRLIKNSKCEKQIS